MIIVGSEECSISKLVSTMRKCGSFHLLMEKWPDIARELEAQSDLVKKIRQDILLDKLQTSDAMAEVVDDWVARCGKEATLQVFNGSLEQHGLKEVKEAIEKVFALASKSTLESFPKYCIIPAELQAFLDQPKSAQFVCILLSLDVEITCQKLEENLEDCSIHDFINFLNMMSSKSSGKKDLYVLSLKEISHLNRILTLAIDKKKLGTARLVVVTSGENKNGIMEMLEPKPIWKNAVQLRADEVEWDDLTPIHQDRILSKLKKTLKVDHLADEELGGILNGQVLIDLINGKDLKLFRETISHPLSYYVDRTLQTRHFIAPSLLSANKSIGILVFTGIRRGELSGLINHEITGNSSNQLQLRKLTVKHIILDYPDHFDQICKLTAEPVHLLHFQDGKFRWLQSSREVAAVQKHIGKSQEPLTEAKFCQSIDPTSSQPVIISDSPGMGKSVLLAQIGRKLFKLYPDRTVTFLVLSELVRSIKKVKKLEMTEAITKTLEKMICVNSLDKLALKSMLKSVEKISMELLLDGFDELGSSEIPVSFMIFNTIRTQFKSVRLWITSRPHLLEELEVNLDTLGYTIPPFSPDDQLQFLASFWRQLHKTLSLDEMKLRQYAEHCLQTLKSNMNSKDHDIAGIPLQCLLIAEIYEAEAKNFASAKEHQILPTLINSILDLYQRLIDKKIEKYVEVYMGNDWSGAAHLMKMHVRLSVQLIFPEHLDKLEEASNPLPVEEIFKVGILERTSAGEAPKFIHRTFAEYFIANYAVSFFRPRLLVALFDCHDSFSNDVGIDSFSFNQPVICYFLNYHIADKSFDKIYSTKNLAKLVDWPDAMQKIAHACVNADLAEMFKLFQEVNGFDEEGKSIFSEKFLLLAIEKSSSALVQLVFNLTEKHLRFDLPLKTNALRAAVRKGDFSTVEWLLKEDNLRQTLEDLNDDSRLLLHECVKDSINNPLQAIYQKKDIVKRIISKNRAMLEQKNDTGETPLLSSHAHVQLLIELVNRGSNVLAKDSKNDTVIHLSREKRMLSPDDYDSLIEGIPETELKALVKVEGEHGHTPLMRLVHLMDPTPDTLNKFKTAGADFSCEDNSEVSLLETAIKNGRSRETIAKIIDCGAEVSVCRGEKGTSRLHLAAQFGNVKAVELFIDDYKMDVNIADEEGFTPLDYAIKSDVKQGKRFETGLALYRGGGRFQEIVNSNGQSSLHFAAQRGSLQSVQLLLHIGANVNAVDGDGNTPLHLLMSEWDPLLKTSILRLFLDSNANPNQQNKDGETPFYLALKVDRLGMEAFILLVSKADWTPETASLALMFLVRNGGDLSEQEFDALTQELVDNDADCNRVDEEGNSLLHIAIDYNHERAFHFLLSKKVEMDMVNKFGLTPLHLAERQVDDMGLKVIKILIENGSNPYAGNGANCTFLFRFIVNCKSPGLFDALVEFLVEKKLCDLFNIPQDIIGQTPFHIAVSNIEIKQDTLMLLRSNSVNFNAVDKRGYSVLAYAVRKNRSENISSLIGCGADWKALTHYKSSMLHLAAQYGSLESLKIFLDLGGLDINGADGDGNTPLHCAGLQKGREGVLEKCRLLISRGADVNILNKAGRTPLEYALTKINDDDVYQELKSFITDNVTIGTAQPILKTANILEHRLSNMENDDGDNCTIISNFLSQTDLPTSADFHDLCSSYFEKGNTATNFNVSSGNLGRNLFQEAVLKLEIERRTLALLFTAGADFNAADKNGDALLAYAVRGKRSPDFLSALINDYGADPQSKNKNNESLLHISAVHGTPRTLELLLRFKELDINGKDTAGYSPLHRLVKKADPMTEDAFLEKYRLLVDHGADVNSVENFNKTPLHSVSGLENKKHSLNIIKCLIEDGADIHAKDHNHRTILHTYISIEPIPEPVELHALAEYLIGKGHSDLFNAVDRNEQTPLHFAVYFLEPEERTLVLLHSNGVNFDAVSKDGTNILTIAIVGKRSKQFLHTLVTRFGVDPTKLDKDENSLLHYLARLHSSDTLKFFLDLRLDGIDINGKDVFGNTPLHSLFIASRIEVLEKCRLLVSRGADVNSTNKHQFTPLHCLTVVKDMDVTLKAIKFLLENGADPLATDENNATFLHYYFLKEHLRCSTSHFPSLVEYLFSKNCFEIFDVPEGKFGRTLMHLMVEYLEPEEKTMTLLHSRAVNFNSVDSDGYSVLWYALVEGKRSTNFLSNLVSRFGADPKHLNNNGESMLHTAAWFGTADALKLFLGYDLDINKTKTKFGNTPLHYAVHPNSSKIDVLEKCRLLVGKGADVNIVNREGDTPLSLVEKFYDGADKEELLILLK